MKKIFTLFCLLCSVQAYTQTTRVLFIGNSFVASNDLPGIFNDMATAAGYNVQVMGHAPGGIFVGDTRQGNQAHANNPITYDIIRQEKWDYVVIQDNQGFYSWDYGWFPPVADEVNSHRKLRDSAVANNPCARVILFSGWCFKNGWQGSPPTFATGSDMNQRVYENYCFLNKSLDEIVTPISISWNRIIKDLPNMDLWSPDEAHPSYEGSYLAAATIFASIFKTSPEPAMFNGPIDSADARHMRKTAYQVVIDSLQPTNLAKYVIALKQNHTKLKADAGYTGYQWYRNDTLVTTTQADSLVIDTIPACYRVVAIDSKGCTQRSVKNCVTFKPKPGAVHNIQGQTATVYPNPNAGTFNVVLSEPSAHVAIELYNLTGSMVYSKSFEGTSGNIYKNEMPGIAGGIYFLKIKTDTGMLSLRLHVEK